MAAQDGSTLGIGVLMAQGLAGPGQELVFSKTTSCQQTIAWQLWRPLTAGLGLLAQCGRTRSSRSDLAVLSQAALTCPFLSSLAADFAFLCNGASEDSERGAELRERPRYEYGPGLEDPHYGLPSPDMGPYYNYLESEYGNPDAGFPRREPNSEFRGGPLHLSPRRSPPHYLPSQTGEYWETQSGAFHPACVHGDCLAAPTLARMLLAALSRSWPHQHHLAMCPMSTSWLNGGSPCSDTALPPSRPLRGLRGAAG